MKLPNLQDKAGRDELAQYLTRCIEAGLRQHGNMDDRWSRLEAIAKCIPTDEGSNYDETSMPRTFPLMGPKLDQLVGAVVGPVLTSKPYFTGIGYGESKPKAQKGSEVNQFLLEKNGFDRWFRQAVRRATTSEPAIVFCWFEEGDAYGQRGPCAEIIHPRNFVLYPAYRGGIRKATLCADRYYARAEDLVQGAESKEFFPEAADIKGGDKPDDVLYSGSVRPDPYLSGNPEDDAIECFRIVVKLDGKYHLCKLAKQKKVLLSCVPYGVERQKLGEPAKYTEFYRPGYFEVFLQESEENEFLREVPVAHKLQGLQLVFDKLINNMVDGSDMAAQTAIIATGAVGNAGKLIEYEPGSVLEMPGDVKLFPVPTTFNPGEMPQLVTLMSELADAASRVSQAGQGQEFSGSPTATEVAGVLQGQRMGLDEYRSNACNGIAELCQFNITLAQLYFERLIEYYGPDFPAQSIEEFAGDYTFEPTGKTMESTPGALVEKVKLAMEMAGQLVQAGLVNPMLLVTFFKMVIQALNLPIESHVIDQFIPTGLGADAGALPQPGMGMDPQATGGGIEEMLGQLLNAGSGGGPDALSAGAGQIGNPPVPAF